MAACLLMSSDIYVFNDISTFKSNDGRLTRKLIGRNWSVRLGNDREHGRF